MKWKKALDLKVGDTVVLNDHGLQSIFGSTVGLSHLKTKQMRITHVDQESMTTSIPTHPVRVNDPEFNRFLIDHHDFDLVRRM